MIVLITSCTASLTKDTYTWTTFRVSDEDFNSLFTDAVVTMSSIHCLTLCTRNRTNMYYDSNTRRCRCQGTCASYSPVSTGRNYVEEYYIPPTCKSLNMHSNMSSFCSFCTTFCSSVCLNKLCLFFLASLGSVIITPCLEQEDGWIIIQRRVDASVSFERSWDEYAAGFGDVDGSFWLGLEALHDLTTAQPMSLQIDIVPFNIPAVSIPYQQFHVGDAASEYLLNITSDTDSPGSNNLYNSFSYNSGSKFTTYDNDNDNHGLNCAAHRKAGWWFDRCTLMNLNGVYGGTSEITHYNMRMQYLSDSINEPIRTVTMKIKAIN